MRKRKGMACTLSLILVMALTGCGGSGTEETESTEAVRQNPLLENDNFDYTSPAEPVSDDEFYSEMEGILSGTTWAGISSAQKILVASFDGASVYLAALDTDGTLSDISGYWQADMTTLYFYENEDYSDDPVSLDFEWYTTEEGEYIQIGDVILSREENEDGLEATLDEMAVTASVIEYVAQGTYWIGSGDATAMIFYFEDDHAFFDLLYEEDGEIKDQPISGLWSLDYDYLTIIDDETDMSYELEWNLSQEGDNYCFELTEDGETYYLYESAAEDVSSTLEILTSYLTTEEEVDETDIDISTFLEGYTGHSVIDAFMLSGLSPDFETRSYCASILGYSSYSGTSEENLTMIELMGGTVR